MNSMHPMSRVTSWRGTQKCALKDLPLERVRLVLVPGRGRAVEGRLVDGVIEAMLDGAPEQSLGDRRAAGERQSVRELRLEVAAVEGLPRMASRCGRSFSGCGRSCRLTTGVSHSTQTPSCRGVE